LTFFKNSEIDQFLTSLTIGINTAISNLTALNGRLIKSPITDMTAYVLSNA